MTSLQQEPSAQAPWTRTMFGEVAISRVLSLSVAVVMTDPPWRALRCPAAGCASRTVQSPSRSGADPQDADGGSGRAGTAARAPPRRAPQAPQVRRARRPRPRSGRGGRSGGGAAPREKRGRRSIRTYSSLLHHLPGEGAFV